MFEVCVWKQQQRLKGHKHERKQKHHRIKRDYLKSFLNYIWLTHLIDMNEREGFCVQLSDSIKRYMGPNSHSCLYKFYLITM